MITKITISGLDIDYDHGYLIGNTAGFDFAEILTSIRNRGSYDGARLGTYNYGRRTFSIEGEIWGTNPSTYEEKRRNLEKCLQFDIDNGVKTITITTRSGLSLQTDGIIKSVDLPYQKGNMMRGKFRFEIESPFPYLLSSSLSTQDVYPASGGGFAIPFEIPFDISAGATGSINVPNNGNGFAYPVITIYGGIVNPSIRNANQDKTLSISYTLSSPTDYIELDMYNRTAKLGGSVNVLQYVSGDWFTLSSGDNVITFFGTSPSSSSKITVSFRDSYIGI